MAAQTFRQRLLAHETLIGPLVATASSEIVELLASLEFDWLFLDAEHGAYGPEKIPALLQAAGNCPCLVRIPGPDEAWIKKVLDAGAAGIIVPQISTLEQAKSVINYSKYPPMGKRGVGLGRAHGYGKDFSSYLQHANDQTVIVLQAETRAVLECIEDIATLTGVDCILIGPYDLSASLGRMGETTHPDVQNAIQKIRQACVNHDTQLGIFGICADHVAPYKKLDFTLLTVGVDTLFVLNSATAELEALRKAQVDTE
jgi:2-keto-3-deoxy-L-rhamnonate aldolase RhmA